QVFSAVQTRIKTYVCPSDNPDEATAGRFAFFNTYRSGNTLFLQAYYFANPTGASLGPTNYLGVRGYFGNIDSAAGQLSYQDNYEGIFGNRTKLSIGNVAGIDGTSNTFMFGEAMGAREQSPRNYSLSWVSAGAIPTAWGLPLASSCANPGDCWWTFGSRH